MVTNNFWRTITLVAMLTTLAGCGGSAATPATGTTDVSNTDLTGIKTYLIATATKLNGETTTLQTAAQRYYDLAKAQNFDYAALFANQSAQVSSHLQQAKTAWMVASPAYEQIEGIVAGVPSLADYDVILDAGAAASDDPENAVPFDLTLPDGRVLPKPGNLFGLLEGALWGTRSEFTASATADLNGNGAQEFGEVLPDANMIKGAADVMQRYTTELVAAAQQWQPSESDAFTALVVMIPTMSEYFESWKQSRFVAGNASAQSDFVVISRLADVQDILSGLQVVYNSVSPRIAAVDAAQNTQISQGLTNLRSFVGGVHSQEQGGKQFQAEEADVLGGEAQNQATALAGQISQVAARLNVPIVQ